MGRKSREKRDRVAPVMVRSCTDCSDCTGWGWKEWVGLICVCIFFYGGFVWVSEFCKQQIKEIPRGQQLEANKKYVEDLFK
jgi:hypothetical protein